MPTYEYACTSCRRRFEVVQRFSDAPLTTCEECGGTLKRVFHPVGVVLKGSGFYATDNRSSKKFKPASDKGAETSASSEKSDGSTSSGTSSSGTTSGTTSSTS